jgi:hypothetical protein
MVRGSWEEEIKLGLDEDGEDEEKEEIITNW